jgi:hypothetical protein
LTLSYSKRGKKGKEFDGQHITTNASSSVVTYRIGKGFTRKLDNVLNIQIVGFAYAQQLADDARLDEAFSEDVDNLVSKLTHNPLALQKKVNNRLITFEKKDDENLPHQEFRFGS